MPLQITWLGFNNSTGLKEIDYILADVNTVKNEEKDYGTKIYKLPEIWNSHCVLNTKEFTMTYLSKKITILPLVHLIIL